MLIYTYSYYYHGSFGHFCVIGYIGKSNTPNQGNMRAFIILFKILL